MYTCNQCKSPVNLQKAVRRYQKTNNTGATDRAYCACGNFIYRDTKLVSFLTKELAWYGVTLVPEKAA